MRVTRLIPTSQQHNDFTTIAATKSCVFAGNIDSYLSACTPTEQKIAKIILEFRYAQDTILTRDYIASRAGCTIRTVTRATTKFHNDNFITKSQENVYAPNHFFFNEKTVKGPDAYQYWYNTQPKQNRDLYHTHGIRVDHEKKIIFQYEYVPQSYSYFLRDSLYNKTVPVTRACATVPLGKTRKKEQVGAVAMKPEQMKWIRSHRNDPRVKEMMSNEKIKAELFTPEMYKIAELLSLEERERLKMIAFPKEAVKYALDFIAPIVSGSRTYTKPVDDKLGWLMGILIGFCRKNNIQPDWGWHRDIADITGLQHNSSDNPKKPLITSKPAQVKPMVKNPGYSSYHAWVSPTLPSVEEQIVQLKKDIATLEKNIAYILAGPTPGDAKYEFAKILHGSDKQNLQDKRAQLAQLEGTSSEEIVAVS